MRFSFKAFTPEGNRLSSFLEAETLEEAKERIEEKGFYLISISKSLFHFKNPFKKTSVLFFTEQMSQLLKAHIPIAEALKIMQFQDNGGPLGDRVKKLRSSVESGLSLHESLAKMNDFFDPFYCKLIEMGEKTAQLAITFEHLALQLKAQQKRKKQIVSALSYPAILFLFCLLLALLSFFYLLPSLEELFAERSSSKLTQTLFALSRHLRAQKWVYLFSFLIPVSLWKQILQWNKFKSWMHAVRLKLPFFKALSRLQFLYPFFNSLFLLTRSNVPLLESLNLCKDFSKYPFFRTFISRCHQKIESGSSMSEAMQTEVWLPPLCHTLIGVGENSGELACSFEHLAEHFKNQLEDQMKKGITLLSPMLLIMMGLLIGLLTLGILLPLTDFQALTI